MAMAISSVLRRIYAKCCCSCIFNVREMAATGSEKRLRPAGSTSGDAMAEAFRRARLSRKPQGGNSAAGLCAPILTGYGFHPRATPLLIPAEAPGLELLGYAASCRGNRIESGRAPAPRVRF
jgi:hypothetical protein